LRQYGSVIRKRILLATLKSEIEFLSDQTPKEIEFEQCVSDLMASHGPVV